MSKFSIIVPVYNIKDYIERCIHSVLNQTYANFELILVDDGSSDASAVICDSWKKKDSRIVVLHQDNAGASAARNKGLQYAGVFSETNRIPRSRYGN